MADTRLYRWVDLDGRDTREIGVKILRLPPIMIAEESVIEHTIPGREEPLLERLGEYHPLIRNVECFYDGTDPSSVAAELAQATTARFSNEQDYIYDCAVVAPHELTRMIVTWHKFVLQLRCQPLKREEDPELLTGLEVILDNTGNVPARPVITLTVDGTESVTLTVGAQLVFLQDVSGTVIVDCWRRVVHDGAGVNLSQKMTGAFPSVAPGDTVTISADEAETMTVEKNLRWR